MPNRIIKESICTSDSIARLSWFEEVLFYRLIVNCDDFGRFDGRPAIIKNRLFPLKESLTTKAVSEAVNTLVTAGMVALYEFEGKPYLYLPSWNDHQNVRAKRSKFPEPCGNVNASASICKQMNTNAPVIQSESESISESEKETLSIESVKKSAPRFTPPTVETVAAYCRERGNSVDAERFCSFYQSNGWKVGKNPMKDWKAAVRTWEKNGFEGKQAKPYKAPQSFAVDEFFEKAMKKSYGEEKHGLS